MMFRDRRPIALMLLLLSMAVPAVTKAGAPAYTGSASCRECHERFYELWAPSHHGLAMQPYATARTNLTEQQTPINVGDWKYRADLAKGTVIARGPKEEKSYPMVETLGGKNVFYFLTPFDRGRLQVLPVAYDVRRKEWFDTAASAVRHLAGPSDSPLHWTESPYTFNTACFSCHVSQLTNHYTLKTDSYNTSWGEPGINCETCHGPAGEHIRVARETPKGQPLKELKLITIKPFSSEQVNAMCGSCHAKMYPLTKSFTPGEKFFDHFGLAALEQTDFYPDGRDLGENFTYTTWRQSPCLKSDKLNCVTCHTSSGRWRFRDKPNDACQPCHAEKVRDIAAHSHHKAGPKSPTCVSCHMPMTEFARMLRTDHSMRPPTPATTVAYKSPNACNLCHQDKDAAWADRQVRQWHPDDYQAPVLARAALIAAARKQDWTRLPAMTKYLESLEHDEIFAGSLLQLLRACPNPEKWPGVIACLKDGSPFVRGAAVEAIGDNLRPDTLPLLIAATRDEYRLVRIRAANALASVPAAMLPEPDRKSLNAATEELQAFFTARPDSSASYHNLGNFYLERRDLPKAVESFQTATRLNPQDISSLVNVSLAYNLGGENEKAEASLRQALQMEPTNAAIHLNLGMLLAEMDKLPEAEGAFRAALKQDPKSAQAAFNLGVLLAKEKPEESLNFCRQAAELRPQEPKYAYTLAFFQQQQGKTADAVATLEKLIGTKPAHPDSYGLLARIYQTRGETKKATEVFRKAAANPNLTEEERSQFRARLTE